MSQGVRPYSIVYPVMPVRGVTGPTRVRSVPTTWFQPIGGDAAVGAGMIIAMLAIGGIAAVYFVSQVGNLPNVRVK